MIDTDDELRKILEFHKRVMPNGCIEWRKGYSEGYGTTRFKGVKERLHRLSAYLYLGYDLNSDLQVNHKCNNKKCYNPDHLYVGTQKDNMRDANTQTHCPNGHELFGDNLYRRPDNGTRQCRACKHEAMLRYYANHRRKNAS